MCLVSSKGFGNDMCSFVTEERIKVTQSSGEHQRFRFFANLVIFCDFTHIKLCLCAYWCYLVQ